MFSCMSQKFVLRKRLLEQLVLVTGLCLSLCCLSLIILMKYTVGKFQCYFVCVVEVMKKVEVTYMETSWRFMGNYVSEVLLNHCKAFCMEDIIWQVLDISFWDVDAGYILLWIPLPLLNIWRSAPQSLSIARRWTIDAEWVICCKQAMLLHSYHSTQLLALAECLHALELRAKCDDTCRGQVIKTKTWS